jgi:hypothetical protein
MFVEIPLSLAWRRRHCGNLESQTFYRELSLMRFWFDSVSSHFLRSPDDMPSSAPRFTVTPMLLGP